MDLVGLLGCVPTCVYVLCASLRRQGEQRDGGGSRETGGAAVVGCTRWRVPQQTMPHPGPPASWGVRQGLLGRMLLCHGPANTRAYVCVYCIHTHTYLYILGVHPHQPLPVGNPCLHCAPARPQASQRCARHCTSVFALDSGPGPQPRAARACRPPWRALMGRRAWGGREEGQQRREGNCRL